MLISLNEWPFPTLPTVTYMVPYSSTLTKDIWSSPYEEIARIVGKCQAHLRSSILPNGLVVLNGVTLTVMECLPDRFSFALIPYIWEHTNLGEIQPGTYSTWRPISMGAT